MVENIYERIVEKPRAAFELGRGSLLAGSALLLAGVIARAMMTIINGPREVAKMPPLNGLADLYPQLPTWFVPEGALGFACAGLLAAAGTALAMAANDVLRQFKRGGIDY